MSVLKNELPLPAYLPAYRQMHFDNIEHKMFSTNLVRGVKRVDKRVCPHYSVGKHLNPGEHHKVIRGLQQAQAVLRLLGDLMARTRKTPPEQYLYTIRETQQKLSASRTAVYELRRSGALKDVRTPFGVRITHESVEHLYSTWCDESDEFRRAHPGRWS
jgi:hypothetical protein